MQRSRRVTAGLGAAALLVVGVGATRVLRAPPAITVGSRVPVIGAPTPGVWIFARRNCGHCDTHLALLRQVMQAYPDSLRFQVARRLVVVGDVHPPCDGIRVLPDSLRRALGVRWTPETWFVSDAGRVTKSWRGARSVRAWRSALAESACLP